MLTVAPALALNFFFAFLFIFNPPVNDGNNKRLFFSWQFKKFMGKFVKFMKAIESKHSFTITFIY